MPGPLEGDRDAEEQVEMVVDTLVLLIGAQPLPNYLALATLRPSRALLIHTEQTRDVCTLLTKVAASRLGIADISPMPLESATDAATIARIVESAPGRVHLNCTGGTKAMAVHARLALFRQDSDPRAASYIDDRSGSLLFDDGWGVPLETATLEMAAILELHGLMAADSHPSPRGPTSEDALLAAAHLIPRPALAMELCDRLRVEKGKPPPEPFDVSDFLPAVGIFPREGWDSRTTDKWRKFLRGGWLEMWVESLVRTIVTTGEVRRGVRPVMGSGRDFDIDVLASRRHRAYAIECTIDAEVPLCKLKLFQVALRARQLGGDLARSALVCMVDGQVNEGKKLDLLRHDVHSIWDAPNVPQVFGLEQLRSWLGTEAVKPDLTSLRSWLEQ